MRRLVGFALSLMLVQGVVSAVPAAPATATGPEALALSAIVARYSSLLSTHDRSVLARLFDGDLIGLSADQKISVEAATVVCRTSNVDITSRYCELTFGTHRRILKGRQANELNATAAVAGVRSEGAAGLIIASFSHLACTIDPNEIKRETGSGAECTFDTRQRLP